MNAWDRLKNAKLIDKVLNDLKADPKVFAESKNAVCSSEAYTAAWNAAYDAVWDASCNMIWDATYTATRRAAYDADWGPAYTATDIAAYTAARNEAWGAAYTAAYITARDAIIALIAYDDSPKYLAMTYDRLCALAESGKYPAAVLLLPYVWVKEKTVVA